MEADSGTIGYLSPEAMESWVYKDLEHATPRKDFGCKESDVFAVGATLFEMITYTNYMSIRECCTESNNAETGLVDMPEYIDQCRSLEVRGRV